MSDAWYYAIVIPTFFLLGWYYDRIIAALKRIINRSNVGKSDE